MKSYEASSSIEASPDVIWPILTDGKGLKWESGVVGFEAEAERRISG